MAFQGINCTSEQAFEIQERIKLTLGRLDCVRSHFQSDFFVEPLHPHFVRKKRGSPSLSERVRRRPCLQRRRMNACLRMNTIWAKRRRSDKSVGDFYSETGLRRESYLSWLSPRNCAASYNSLFRCLCHHHPTVDDFTLLSRVTFDGAYRLTG